MEIPEEATSSSKDDYKEKDHPTRKKHSKTLFATRMKNKKNEEKFCKDVSVHITKIPSQTVPKSVSPSKPKKRRCQWNKGIVKKRKIIHKTEKTVSGNFDIKTSELTEESTEDQNNTDIQKKSARSCTSPTNKKVDSKSESDVSHAGNDEKVELICQRTIPFVGKLITKEARMKYLEKFYTTVHNDLQARADEKKEVLEQNQNLSSKCDDKIEKTENVVKETTNISKSNDKLECVTSSKTKKTKPKKTHKKPVENTSKKDNLELTNQDLKKPFKTVSDTKDNPKDVKPAGKVPILNETCTNTPDVINELDTNENSSNNKSDSVSKNQNPNVEKNLSFSNTDKSETCKNANTLKDSSKDFNSLNTSLKDGPEPSTAENNLETVSCRRTEVYYGKLYPQCSRTLPYVELVKEILKTSRTRNLNSSTEVRSNQEKTNEVDETNETIKVETDSNIQFNKKNEIDVPLKSEKRKHPITPENESQDKEGRVSKKIKRISGESTAMDKKLNSSTSKTPEKKICSLFSTNCKKHNHCNQHHPLDQKCPVKDNNRLNHQPVVELIDIRFDPLAAKYFSKITKVGLLVEKEGIHDTLLINENIVKKNRRRLSSTKEENVTTKDDTNEKVNSTNNPVKVSQQSKLGSEIETVIKSKEKQKTSKRTNLDNSLEKLNHPEDSDDSFSFMKRSKNNRPKNSESTSSKSNLRRYDSQEWGGSDAEVEEFSRLGQEAEINQLNLDDTNEAIHVPTTRSKSRAAEAFKNSSFNTVEEKIDTSSRTLSKTPSLNNLNQPSSTVSHKKHFLEDDSDNETEEISKNIIRKRKSTVITSPILTSHSELNNNTTNDREQTQATRTQTPTENLQPLQEESLPTTKSCTPSKTSSQTQACEVHELVTPKKVLPTLKIKERVRSTSISNADTPVKSSKTACEDDKSITPKKILPTLKLKETAKSDGMSCNLDTPVKPSKRISPVIVKSKSRIEGSDKNLPVHLLKKLKVQVIDVKNICKNYEEYTASELERLTNKYIDLLMNSNFSRGNWVVPTNYYKPPSVTEKHASQVIDSSLAFSENENTNVELNAVSTEEAEEVIICPSPTVETEKRVIQETPQKLDNVNNLTSLEDAISELVDLDVPSEGIRVSNVTGAVELNVANPENRKEQSSDSNQDCSSESGVSISEKETSGKKRAQDEDEEDRQLIIVTEAPSSSSVECSLCDKVFDDQNLLDEHKKSTHITTKNDDVVSATHEAVTTPSTSLEKSAPNSTGRRKKLSKGKKKKKLRAENSENDFQCSMCVKKFENIVILFEHLLTHDEKDLQQALETAKNKNGEEVQTTVDEAENTEVKRRKSSEIKEVPADKPTPTMVVGPISSVDKSQGNESENMCESDDPIAVSVKLCPCHAHETKDQELQIEMNLLCKGCDVLFRRRDCFETHFRTSLPCRQRRNDETLNQPQLFCSSCPRLLASLFEMRSHLQMHASKDSRGTVTFLCNICKVAFFGIGSIFYAHWVSHEKQPNFIASRWSFPKLSVVSVLDVSNNSMTTVKTQEGFFYIAEHVCQNCRVPFSSDQDLKIHREKPCQASVKTSRVQTTVVNGTRPHMLKLVCDLCNKFYPSKENFDKHCAERNHLKTPTAAYTCCRTAANDEVIVCDLCNVVRKSSAEMEEHFKRVHSPVIELYICKSCNMGSSNNLANTYDSYDELEKHFQLHHNQMITCLVYFANTRYACEICKVGFENELSLNNHKMSHNISQVSNLPSMNTAISASSIQSMESPIQTSPVYLQYPNNARPMNASFIVTSSPANMVHVNLPNQVQMQHPQIQLSTVPTVISSQNSPSMINVVRASTSNDSLLRNILDHRVIEQEELAQLNQVSTDSPIISRVETICLDDSRSNSPASDSTSSITVVNQPDTSKKVNSPSKSTPMTMVNPEFESILGNNNSASENSSDKPSSNSADESSANENSSLAPFEIVLLTDDLSDNSVDTPVIEKVESIASTVDTTNSNTLEKPLETNDSAAAKKFLRVRSIAELQSIKVHDCKICNIKFNSPQELELHSQQHTSAATESGRSTPVQAISPMNARSHRKATSDPQNILRNQIRHNMSSLVSNGIPSVDSSGMSDSNVVNSSALPRLLPITQGQQQNSPYWSTQAYSSIGSMNTSTVPTGYNNRHTLPNLLRKPGSSSRPPPPPYPGSSPHPMGSARSSSIQLPVRNIASVLPTNQQPQRPSGAATRIPQQSIATYQDTNDRRQQEQGHVSSYPCTTSSTRGPIMSQMIPNHSQRMLPQQPARTFVRQQFYPNNVIRPTQQQSYQLLPQQQPLPGSIQQLQQSSFERHPAQRTNVQQLPANQQQRHVSVNQMPERIRQPIVNNQITPELPRDEFFCNICRSYCSSQNELNEHINRVHNTTNGQVFCYVCDYCPKPLIFESEALLRNHMDHKHNHFCEVCRKRYPSRDNLLLHMEEHMRNT